MNIRQLKKRKEKRRCKTKMAMFHPATLDIPSVVSVMEEFDLTSTQAQAQIDRLRGDKVYVNNLYQVNVSFSRTRVAETDSVIDEIPTFHLSIRRRDRAAKPDWRHFQEIKNVLIGHEYEAVELFPSESRLVDVENQFHLWGFYDEKFRFPFGFGQRSIGSESIGGAVQLPREDVGVADGI